MQIKDFISELLNIHLMNLRVLHLPQYYGESNWTAPAETL
jgi:hypothetical protein